MLTLLKINHKLKKSGINYRYLVIGVVLLSFFIFPGKRSGYSNTKYEAYLIEGVDKYSANVLSSYKEGQSVDFSWDQFLSLERFFKDHDYIVKPLTCEEFANRIQKSVKNRFNCDDDPENTLVPITLHENVNMYVSDMNRKVFGKVHLYKTFPNPTSLLYLFHDGQLQIPVNADSKFSKLGSASLRSVVSKHTKFEQDLSVRKPVSFKYEDFHYKKNLNTYPDSSSVKVLHEKYKDTKRARKYFSEAYLSENPNFFNLDWKFFNSSNILSDLDSRNDKITKLTRGWLNFCSKFGVTSWLNSNNVIGWQFNGLHLPFETDFDLQIPIKDLLKLVDAGLNHTIIFDYSDLDKGIKSEMFLDISPYFRMRDRNNKENLVDIRVVDIETGLFLNIIAVSTFQYEKLHNYQTHPVFQSLEDKDKRRVDGYLEKFKDDRNELLFTKNIDVFRFKDVSTVLPVVFENQIAYLPIDYMNILTDKFFDPFSYSKQGFRYRNGINMWVSLDDCAPPQFGGNPTIEEDTECLKNSRVKHQYDVFRKSTEIHEKFMQNFNELDGFGDYTLEPQDLTGFNYYL